MKVKIDISKLVGWNDVDTYEEIAYKLAQPIIKKFDDYLFRTKGAGLGWAGELRIRQLVSEKMKITATAEVKITMKELDRIIK